MSKRHLVLVALFALVQSARSQDIFPNLSPQIVPVAPAGGNTASALVPVNEQKKLGLVSISTVTAAGTGACSGTLLNQYWVLTAHHCIASRTAMGGKLLPPVAPANVTITATWNPANIQPTRIEHFATVPRLTDFEDTSGWDIALLFLGNGDFGPVETDWSNRLWDGTWGNRIPGSGNLDIYGRGISAWARNNGTGYPVKSVDDGAYRVQKAMTAAGPSERWYVASAVIAGGDSGGPTFVQIDTSAGTKTYVAGVHSFCSRMIFVDPRPVNWSDWEAATYALCGDQAVFLIVDAIRDHIAEWPGPSSTHFPFEPSNDKLPFTLYYLVGQRPSPGVIAVAETRLQQEDYRWVDRTRPARHVPGIPRSGLRTIATGLERVSNITSVGGPNFITRSQLGALEWWHQEPAGAVGLRGPNPVGADFLPFRKILGAEDGVLYAIRSNGELDWYRYPRYESGDGGTACPKPPGQSCLANADRGIANAGANLSVYPWSGPKAVGEGWQVFKHVFYAGEGVIYAVGQNGVLKWYRHLGHSDGAKRWSQPGTGQPVGEGWGEFTQVASIGNGAIVALKPNGDLVWYRHRTWNPGNASAPGRLDYREWEGPILIRSGLQNVLAMFAQNPLHAEGPLNPVN